MLPALIAALLVSNRLTTIVLGGDIMLNGIEVKRRPLEKLGPILRPAGVAIANLEIPLTDAKRTTPHKSDADVRDRRQFILKAEPEHGAGIAACGIDLVIARQQSLHGLPLAGAVSNAVGLGEESLAMGRGRSNSHLGPRANHLSDRGRNQDWTDFRARLRHRRRTCSLHAGDRF